MCYTFLDVAYIGGRSLVNASHREKITALISIVKGITNPTDFILPNDKQLGSHWPIFALAPIDNDLSQSSPPFISSFVFPFLQIYKNLYETNIIYIQPNKEGEATKLLNTFSHTVHNEKKTSSCVARKRNVQLLCKTKHPRPTSEMIIIRASNSGPDDYSGVGIESKREGGVLVQKMHTSLTLNRLLRGTNVELYRETKETQARVLKSVKMEARWSSVDKQWKLVCDDQS